MCVAAGPGGPALVRRGAELAAAGRRRRRAALWGALNALLLLVLAYDLWVVCPGRWQLVQLCEVAAAAVAAASAAQHAHRLLAQPPRLRLTRPQRLLLGLHRPDLDSSVCMVEESPAVSPERPGDATEADDLSLSLSPARAWRPASPASRSPAGSAASPGSPASRLSASGSPGGSPRPREPPADEFIADRRSLGDYLRHYEERHRPEAGAAGAGPAAAWGCPPPPHYQLAALDSEGGAGEESGAGAAGGAGGDAGALWHRLDVDPTRLTQFNLNLRLWLHLTVLERLVREMRAVDAALARLGLPARLGEVSVDRLRKLAQSASPGSGLAQLPALLPFLEPFADQRYLVRRIEELASGGCLSAYRWNGGGADWDDAKPTDAELVLHLVAAYLDGQLPGAPGERPFSEAHVSAAPLPPRRPLSVHLVSRRPPHFALALGADTLELPPGRSNLLHTLLLFVAALARRRPPQLRRLHLGRAGLNMLWIIGR